MEQRIKGYLLDFTTDTGHSFTYGRGFQQASWYDKDIRLFNSLTYQTFEEAEKQGEIYCKKSDNSPWIGHKTTFKVREVIFNEENL